MLPLHFNDENADLEVRGPTFAPEKPSLMTGWVMKIFKIKDTEKASRLLIYFSIFIFAVSCIIFLRGFFISSNDTVRNPNNKIVNSQINPNETKN